MKVAKKTNVVSPSVVVEALEGRALLAAAAAPWGVYPALIGQDRVVANYPWLTGAGFGVAVVDKGIDYLHPLLGGKPKTGTPSPRITNVHDYKDGDDDPFPDTSEAVDSTSPHATGVAGILAGVPTVQGGKRYQGVLQGAQLYNLRTDSHRSGQTIAQALDWVVANHERYNITAVNLTDFIGDKSNKYETQLKKLWDAGVFVLAPVANDWLGDEEGGAIQPGLPIGYPAISDYVFGIGGVLQDGSINQKTQRGAALDLLGPSFFVSLPYYTPSVDKHVWVERGRGTSWAGPYVSGTAVLMRQIDPTLKPAEIMQLLKESGPLVPDPDAAKTGIAGYHRLDMFAAINLTYRRRDDSSDHAKGGNDSMAAATPIALDANGMGSITNRKLLIGDHDYYAFTAARAGQYVVSSIGGAQILDAAGNVVGTVGATGKVARSLVPGQYYVHLQDTKRTLPGTYSVGISGPTAGPGGNPGTPPTQRGTFNDLKYDTAGRLHFAWFDRASRTLKYAVRSATKSWGGAQTVDGAVGAGHFVSMALDGEDRPGVAYYDAANGDLKYAKFDGTAWRVQTVDSAKTVGYYPSLEFDGADNPVIAYYYKTGGALRLAAYNGSAWKVATVDAQGDVGRYPSLARNPADGRWAVAYETTSGGAFKYAQMGRGGAWSTTVVDANGAGGGFISLAFDGSNQPAFSYYDAKNADLKFARRSKGVWGTRAIAAKNSQGLYSNLFFEGGDPVIYYFNKTANTLNAARGHGKSWALQLLTGGGGRENRVTRDPSGFETYSWFDDTASGLKVRDA